MAAKFKVLKIISTKKHSDSRGYLRETFKKNLINWNNLIFDYSTTSKKNVLRGFHFQSKFMQAKLINVLKGKILDCVIDLRKKSKTFGKSFKIFLSEKNNLSLYIPRGFAHSYLTLDNENIVYYKSTILIKNTEDEYLISGGRNINLQGFEKGFYIGGCLFDNVKPNMKIYK